MVANIGHIFFFPQCLRKQMHFLKINFFIGVTVDLQNSCKDSTERSLYPLPTFPPVVTLSHSVRTAKKLTLVHCCYPAS